MSKGFRSRSARAVGVALLVAVVVSSCGGGSASRPDVLADLAADQMVPAYTAASEAAQDLALATETLCADPTEEARVVAVEALTAARAGWKSTEAMWVGPVMERRSWALVDWPVRTEEIEALISDPAIVIDDDLVTLRVGADQRGLRAIEYLLASGSDADASLAALGDARRCDYLVVLAGVVADELNAVREEWTTSWQDGPAYAEVFAGEAATASLDAVVNDALFLLEAMSDAELGVALGVMGSAANAAAIQEGPAGLGRVDLAARLAGLRAMLVGGADGGGLGALLGDSLTDRLTGEFDRSEAALGALADPLAAALEAAPDDVAAARDALKSIQITVATEIVSRLGVTVGFSDADGDSGG